MCELVDVYILSGLSNIVEKSDIYLYRDDGLLLLMGKNGEQLTLYGKIIKFYEESGFIFLVETRRKEVNYRDVTFNLQNERVSLTKNEIILYIILTQVPSIPIFGQLFNVILIYLSIYLSIYLRESFSYIVLV